MEAERKACEIRIRAERKAGELLREMKENGARKGNGGKEAQRSHGSTIGLAELGITKNQSSRWQQLAAIPATEFEELIAKPGPKPSTEGLVNSQILREAPKPQMDPDALWVWNRLREFERLLERNPQEIISSMTDFMREDTERIVPKLHTWLEALQ